MNKIKSLAGIIFIGAIGSGLWDVFLKGVLISLANVFVSIGSSLFSGYLDHIYGDIGKSPDFLYIMLSIAVIVLFIILPFFFYFFLNKYFDAIKGKRELKSSGAKGLSDHLLDIVVKSKYLALIILLGPSFFMSIVYTDILISELAKKSAINNIERTLEIVRPYVDEEQYYKLRSEYRLIDGKDKLVSLVVSLNNISSMHGIVLPKMQYIGVDLEIAGAGK